MNVKIVDMNIKWVQSRSTKKKEKNKTQAYLRWYEAGKEKSKKLDGIFKYTGRLEPNQRTHNKNTDIDVSDLLNKQKKDLTNGMFDLEKWDKEGRSFVEYGNEYISKLTSKKTGLPAGKGTKTPYIQALRLFERFFGTRKQIHSITKEDVQNFKADLFKNGSSRYGKVFEASTINTYNNRLKLIYQGAEADTNIVTRKNWFISEGYIKIDTENLIKEYINSKEFAMLDPNLCQCPRIAKAFMFSCLTGLRKGDLEDNITWGDLKKDERGWHIYIAMRKGGKLIRISVSPLAMSLLDERRNDDHLLLDFYTSVAKSGFLAVWLAQTFPNKAIGQQSGRSGVVGLTFHSARASYITNMLMAGIPPVRVQTYVGHKDLKTTLSYYRGTTEMQEEDMLKMDNLYKSEMIGLKAAALLD